MVHEFFDISDSEVIIVPLRDEALFFTFKKEDKMIVHLLTRMLFTAQSTSHPK